MSLAQVHVTVPFYLLESRLVSPLSLNEWMCSNQINNKSQHIKDQWYCLRNQRFHFLSPIKFLMKSPNSTTSHPNSIQVSNKYWYKLLFLEISKQKMYPT